MFCRWEAGLGRAGLAHWSTQDMEFVRDGQKGRPEFVAGASDFLRTPRPISRRRSRRDFISSLLAITSSFEHFCTPFDRASLSTQSDYLESGACRQHVYSVLPKLVRTSVPRIPILPGRQNDQVDSRLAAHCALRTFRPFHNPSEAAVLDECPCTVNLK